MEQLLWWVIAVVGLQVLHVVQGWIIMWRCSKLEKRFDAIESELRQFRGVARLKDIPNEQRNGRHKAA